MSQKDEIEDKCNVCGKAFCTNGFCQFHKSEFGKSKRTYMCLWCDYLNFNIRHVQSHQKSEHKYETDQILYQETNSDKYEVEYIRIESEKENFDNNKESFQNNAKKIKVREVKPKHLKTDRKLAEISGKEYNNIGNDSKRRKIEIQNSTKISLPKPENRIQNDPRENPVYTTKLDEDEKSENQSRFHGYKHFDVLRL